MCEVSGSAAAVTRLVALTIGFAISDSTELRAQEPSGTIAGVLLAKETGEPLPYGVVGLPAFDLRRFTNDSGAFVLRDVRPGSHVLQIRRLGYAPQEMTVVVRSGEVQYVRAELTRVALTLTPVQVRADPTCTRPGLRAVKDSSLAIVLTQLRMNGEQYRLLAEAYPFVYAHERTIMLTLKSGDSRIESMDTILVESKPTWNYRPGRILTSYGGRRGGIYFNVPTLADFGDPAFLDNHCFMGGGIDHVAGSALIRIDLLASARIRSPDVNGSIFLDPQNLQIRRSVLRLSRNPRVRGMIGLEVTTVFQEALESVPLVSQVHAVQTYDPQDASRDHLAAHEFHELISFSFRGARPGGDLRP